MPDPIRAVLCDIEGTLMHRGVPIPGAAGAVRALRARGLALRFLTNIRSQPPQTIAQELAGSGFDIASEEIETSVTACVGFLAAQPRSRVLLMVPVPVRPLFASFPEDAQAPDYVVVTGISHGFTYVAINAAYLALCGGARLVAPHKSLFSFVEMGKGAERYLDAGAFIAGLEVASGQQAIVTGKPDRTFYMKALGRTGFEPREALVVGDDSATDMKGAAACGMRSVRVATGKGALAVTLASPHRPTWSVLSIAALPALIDVVNEEAHHA